MQESIVSQAGQEKGKRSSKRPVFTAVKLFALVVIVAASFFGGYLFGYRGFSVKVGQFPEVNIDRELPVEKSDLDFSLFWRVWDTLHTSYFDKSRLKDYDLVYGAIKGMVAAIGDPYTVFLPPAENRVVQEDLTGNFEGVGIQIGFKKSQLAVIAPLPESPAEKAGVKAGDLILAIRDEKKGIDRDTAGITLPEAVQDIRGPSGSKVTLVLQREGEEDLLEIEVTRASIDVPSVTVSYVGGGEKIAHVQIFKFSSDTIDEWEDVVLELLKKRDLKGIIVDVRNNPGGFLEKAVELASDFLETGAVVVTEEDSKNTKQEFRVEKLGRFRNSSVVVLINQGSASASEIFAGALRDNKKTPLVGETTFGKGTIQESQQVNSEAGLHITIARWLTPSGFWVDDGGLKPDIEVTNDSDTPEDEQLQRAIEELERT